MNSRSRILPTPLGTVVVGIALAASGVMAQEATRAIDAAALEGTWVITSINGESLPEGEQEMTLTFAGDKYHQTVGGAVNERGTMKLDASKKPMTIDLVITEGDDAGKTQLGIIEVTGDTIRASLDIPGTQQRPTDFAIREGVVMFVGKKKS